MTIARAIALIKLDIEYYKKQTEIMEKFTDESFKKHDWKSSSSNMQSMANIIQTMCSMMSSLYSTQIKYYEDILVELESNTKQRKLSKLKNSETSLSANNSN